MKCDPKFYVKYKAVVTRKYDGELVERKFYGSTLDDLKFSIQPILSLKSTKGVKYYRMIIVEEELCQS